MQIKHVSYLLLLVSLALFAPTYARIKEEPSTLTLTAQALLKKPADEIQMKVGVVTLSDQAETALTENSIRMQAVVRGLESVGLERSEYETGHFAIHPTYTPYPKDPPADWKQTINGYEVTNSILIHTDKIDAAGKLIDAANKAGANSIESIRFTLQDPQAYRDETIKTATANALADARSVASAAGVQLVKVLSITLENSNVVGTQESPMYLAKAYASNMPPIEPGEVSLTATVTVIYEIAPE